MNRKYQALISRRVAVAVLVGTVSSLALPFSAEAASGLVVIVHPSNQEELSTADVAAIFTTRRQTWKSGGRVIAFNFPAKSPVRVSFDRQILGMGPDQVARYWIDRRVRGGNPPPKQVSSGRTIARLVAKLPGAIAYIPRELATSEVRVALDV